MDDVQGAAVLAELRELRQRVAELEAQTAIESPAEQRSTRRGMLRLAGAAVVGGAAASLVGAQPAAANIGDNMIVGDSSNNGSNEETALTSSDGGQTFRAVNTNQGAGLLGNSTGFGTGVEGIVNSPDTGGYGVWGHVDGTLGFALVGTGGAAQLFLEPKAVTGTPSSDYHEPGEVVCNQDELFTCVIAGFPGTWRKISGPTTAGAFHAVSPTRVYDSRAGNPTPSGILTSPATRTISVADGRDGVGNIVISNLVPVGATAVAANITVTGTQVSGYLAVNPGGVTAVSASTINWFGSGQTLANGTTVPLNVHRELTVVCGGGGATHFIIDVTGYYR